MFEGKAEEALTFYASIIPNSGMISMHKYTAAGPGPEGSVMKALFSIGGLEIMCSDSFVHHAFTFTPSTSLFVTCDTEEELRRLADALGSDGEFLMAIDNYGFSRQFCWLKDRYGVSWQLNF